jgi:eukaryotic-like serine/threonine-protein kinase
LQKSQELTRQAEETALRAERKGTAAGGQALRSLTEAEFERSDLARRDAAAAIALKAAPNVQTVAMLAFARAGDTARAEAIAKDLAQRFPSGTLLNHVWLPTVQALVELDHGNTGNAVELLKATTPYELGSYPPSYPELYSVYTRGRAYLRAGQGTTAASEFQKILDHRGLAGNSPITALAKLGLARARALAGDVPSARTAYQDFFSLWKDADPDIPILQQAKAEYAKLK